MGVFIYLYAVPLYCVGWVVGLLSRPLFSGFGAGWDFMYHAEARRVTLQAQERLGGR